MANSIRLIVAVAMVCLFQLHSAAQSFSVNTDGSIAHPSAILDVKSTDKGILIPRMSKTDKNAITSPATGLIIYQETPDSTGFYYYNSTKWIWLSDGVNKDTTAWKITGNDNITSAHFLGTTNDSALRFRIRNTSSGIVDSISSNTALGFKTILNNTTGINNTALDLVRRRTNY